MSALQRQVIIRNKKGLHARAAAAFVKCVEHYDAEVKVIKDGQVVDGSSILSLMMLAASKGTEITILSQGKDATDVLESLTILVNSGFGEDV